MENLLHRKLKIGDLKNGTDTGKGKMRYQLHILCNFFLCSKQSLEREVKHLMIRKMSVHCWKRVMHGMRWPWRKIRERCSMLYNHQILRKWYVLLNYVYGITRFSEKNSIVKENCVLLTILYQWLENVSYIISSR